MVSLGEEQIKQIKYQGNIDVFDTIFKTETSKFLFPKKLDELKFEQRELKKIDRELRLERDLAKHRIANIIKFRRIIATRVKDIASEKKKL